MFYGLEAGQWVRWFMVWGMGEGVLVVHGLRGVGHVVYGKGWGLVLMLVINVRVSGRLPI